VRFSEDPLPDQSWQLSGATEPSEFVPVATEENPFGLMGADSVRQS
jgi:hypothetical protein